MGITFTKNLTFDSIDWLKIKEVSWNQYKAFANASEEYKNFKAKFDDKYPKKRGLYYPKYVQLIATAQALNLITII